MQYSELCNKIWWSCMGSTWSEQESSTLLKILLAHLVIMLWSTRHSQAESIKHVLATHNPPSSPVWNLSPYQHRLSSLHAHASNMHSNRHPLPHPYHLIKAVWNAAINFPCIPMAHACPRSATAKYKALKSAYSARSTILWAKINYLVFDELATGWIS